MTEKSPPPLDKSAELQAKVKEYFLKFEELRGFL
jgi:hypothetical protein